MNKDYIRFNNLATECDLLECYLKTNQGVMTRYQFNQLKNRLALKQIKRDVAFNNVNWNAMDNNEDEPTKSPEKPLFDLFGILLDVILFVLGLIFMLLAFATA